MRNAIAPIHPIGRDRYSRQEVHEMPDVQPVTPEVAVHVWRWLTNHGLTPLDLAARAGLSIGIVHKVLSGCGYIRMRSRLALVAATGMTWWSLNEPLDRDYTPGLTASKPIGALQPVNFRGSPDSTARDIDHVAIGQPAGCQAPSRPVRASLLASIVRNLTTRFVTMKHRRA